MLPFRGDLFRCCCCCCCRRCCCCCCWTAPAGAGRPVSRSLVLICLHQNITTVLVRLQIRVVTVLLMDFSYLLLWLTPLLLLLLLHPLLLLLPLLLPPPAVLPFLQEPLQLLHLPRGQALTTVASSASLLVRGKLLRPPLDHDQVCVAAAAGLLVLQVSPARDGLGGCSRSRMMTLKA